MITIEFDRQSWVSEQPIHYRQLKINAKNLVFYAVFFLVFTLSGVLTVASGYVYRMGLMSLLVLPLLLRYRVKLTPVVLSYIALILVIILSAIYNRSSVIELITFLRIPIFSFLMYFLVQVAINRQNIGRIFRLCIFIGIIQLPIILLQWAFYEKLPDAFKRDAVLIDYGFGTFNYKTDYAMSFFLTLLVIFMLFDPRRSYFVRYRWGVMIWLFMTVLLANAQIVKVIILLVWGIYLMTHFRLKTVAVVSVATVVVGGLVVWFSSFGVLTEDATTFVKRLNVLRAPQNSYDGYLSGEYDRYEGVLYLLTVGRTMLGDGPSAYSDPITRSVLRGNFGHFFTFASEVGILGWLVSIGVLFFIAFPMSSSTLKLNWVRILSFIAINILAFTSQVMNDIAVMLIYCIVVRTDLLPFLSSHQATASLPSTPSRNLIETIRVFGNSLPD
jgi:hypothetical protein